MRKPFAILAVLVLAINMALMPMQAMGQDNELQFVSSTEPVSFDVALTPKWGTLTELSFNQSMVPEVVQLTHKSVNCRIQPAALAVAVPFTLYITELVPGPNLMDMLYPMARGDGSNTRGSPTVDR